MIKGRGKNPRSWSKEVKDKMVQTQKKVGHPWRRAYPLSIKGMSPDYVIKS